MTDCIFCKIVLGTIPAEFVYQDELVVAFRDLNPQAPVHVLIVPRDHISGLSDASEGDEHVLGHLARTAARIAAIEGVQKSGFRCVVNNGPNAQQSVPHLHMHVIGGRPMTWPPG